MNIKEAKTIPIANILQRWGHSPTKTDGRQVWYLSPLRHEDAASFKVDLVKNVWFDFGLGIGGTIVDLVMQRNKCSITEALRVLSINLCCSKQTFAGEKEKMVAPVIEHMTAIQHVALVSYLASRGIDLTVAGQHCCEVHYKIDDKNYFGIGLKNIAGGMEIRNPYFKGCLGKKAISLIAGQDKNRCAVFEGFMDFLAAKTYYEGHSEPLNMDCVILNSVALIEDGIAQIKTANYSEIVLFVDNDPSGRKATALLVASTATETTTVIDKASTYAGFKDFNDWILAGIKSKE